jgi:acyl dehydratase
MWTPGSGSLLYLRVAHGSLTFAAAAGLSFDEGFANGDAVLSFAAAQADFNTARWAYLPAGCGL